MGNDESNSAGPILGVLALVGASAAGLYYWKTKHTSLDKMAPVIKAPEDLAKEPGIRPSAAEVQQIANDAALTVNADIAAAQEKLLAAELAAQGQRQQIENLKVQQNELIGRISSVQSQYDSLNARVTGANATVSARQNELTSRMNEENAARNIYTGKVAELGNAQLHRNSLAIWQTFQIQQANRAISELGPVVNNAQIQLNNAIGLKSTAQNNLNIAIHEKDRLAAEAGAFKQSNLDPLKAEELAIRNSINQYAIAFAAAEELVNALRTELSGTSRAYSGAPMRSPNGQLVY